MEQLAFTPVIILGAGRSGTNALRDMLTRLSGFTTWDCDEINPIWRHGNLKWPSDEIPATQARPAVRAFIRKAFRKQWKRGNEVPFVIEKTCANTLRVPFIETVLPEARYIHIIRDGVDVLASAQMRWQGNFELPKLPYFIAKARHAPVRDLPIYGLSFLRSRIGLLLGKQKHLSIWGPRFQGIETFAHRSLEEICARQWAACVTKAHRDLSALDQGRVLTLRYEDFVTNPTEVLAQILTFLDTSASQTQIADAAAIVRPTSIGKGRERLAQTLSADVLSILHPALQIHAPDKET